MIEGGTIGGAVTKIMVIAVTTVVMGITVADAGRPVNAV